MKITLRVKFTGAQPLQGNLDVGEKPRTGRETTIEGAHLKIDRADGDYVEASAKAFADYLVFSKKGWQAAY